MILDRAARPVLQVQVGLSEVRDLVDLPDHPVQAEKQGLQVPADQLVLAQLGRRVLRALLAAEEQRDHQDRRVQVVPQEILDQADLRVQQERELQVQPDRRDLRVRQEQGVRDHQARAAHLEQVVHQVQLDLQGHQVLLVQLDLLGLQARQEQELLVRRGQAGPQAAQVPAVLVDRLAVEELQAQQVLVDQAALQVQVLQELLVLLAHLVLRVLPGLDQQALRDQAAHLAHRVHLVLEVLGLVVLVAQAAQAVLLGLVDHQVQLGQVDLLHLQ